MLWLHIYVSMFGLAAVLFFSVTGVTLNHPDWFFGEAERQVQVEGQVDLKWLNVGAPAIVSDADKEKEPDPATQVARLEIVEHLRKTHGVRGALAHLLVDDRECMVSFKGAGYAAGRRAKLTASRAIMN